MKILKSILTIATIGASSAVWQAYADDGYSGTGVDKSSETLAASPMYRAQEFSIDAFGSGSVGQHTIDNATGSNIRHDGIVGGGVGVNYFFLRYLGVGGDFAVEGDNNVHFESTSGNVIARIPIGESGLAPYAFGGGGYQFDAVRQSFGQGGLGLEFRFTKQIGIFVDARYIFADKTDNYGMGRAGIRFSF